MFATPLARCAIRIVALAIALCTLLVSFTPLPVSAQEEPAPNDKGKSHRERSVLVLEDVAHESLTQEPSGIPARWSFDDEPVVLAGYEDDAHFEVAVPAGWSTVGDGRFVASVVASEIASDDLSLRIDIDDRPAQTWTLSDNAALALDLPGELLDDGVSIDAVTTSPLINDDACPDPFHVGRWVDLGRPAVEATIAAEDLDIARTVTGLATVSSLTSQPIAIGVADLDVADAATLDATGAIVAAMSAHGTAAGWVVTDPSDTPTGIAGQIRVLADPTTPAAITLDVVDGRPVLTLRGESSGMSDIAHALADPDRMLWFHDDHVPASTVPEPIVTLGGPVSVFGDLGYDNRTLRGFGQQSLVYRVHVPASMSDADASIALSITHAPELAEHEAAITVRLNDGNDEVVALASAEGRVEVLYDVQRSASPIRPGLNYVTVSTDLGPPSAQPCELPVANWMTVSNASGFGLDADARVERVAVDVSSARFALASEVDLNETEILIPERPSVIDLAHAVDAVAALAARAESGAPRLVTDIDANPDRHHVYVGRSNGRPKVAPMIESTMVSPDLPNGLGLMIAAPAAEPGRIALAALGSDPVGVDLAIDALFTGRVNDIEGRAAVASLDAVRPLGPSRTEVLPSELAFNDRDAGPSALDYEEWLLAQAARIDDAQAPQIALRRMVAVGMIVAVAAILGLAWIRRIRMRNASGVAGH